MKIGHEIAIRFLLHGGEQFTRLITWVSFVGLLLGVMILTVVVSVMNGFDNELKSRLLSAIPHVVLEGQAEVPAGVIALEEVEAAFPFYEGMAMVARGRAVTPVSVYGLDAAGLDAFAEIRKETVTGSLAALSDTAQGIVLGAPLAAHLGLALNDAVALVFPTPGARGVAPVQRRFTLVGTFELGAELDTSLALISLASVPPRVLESSGERGVQLRLRDPLDAAAVQSRLRSGDQDAVVSTWMERFSELFQAVRMEKAMMFVILSLVVAVASFNIVSGQYMLVRKKTPAISILRTMGADSTFIARIFLLQGLLVGIIGVLAGLVLGVLGARNINEIVGVFEGLLGVRFLEGTYFATIPVAIEVTDLVTIGLLSLAISLWAAYLPARRARALSPIAGLHGV